MQNAEWKVTVDEATQQVVVTRQGEDAPLFTASVSELKSLTAIISQL